MRNPLKAHRRIKRLLKKADAGDDARFEAQILSAEMGSQVQSVIERRRRKMRNPFKRPQIVLRDIKIPVGKGYTMNGTVVDVIHELQANIIILQDGKTRLKDGLIAKQIEINKLNDEIASLNRKLFQKAR